MGGMGGMGGGFTGFTGGGGGGEGFGFGDFTFDRAEKLFEEVFGENFGGGGGFDGHK